MTSNDNGWEEYQKLVMTKLNEYREDITKIFDTLTEIKEDISALKVKAGMWGAFSGMMTGVLAALGLKKWS